jgi:hypothetical protein
MSNDIHNFASQHLNLASDRMKARYDQLPNSAGFQKCGRVPYIWLGHFFFIMCCNLTYFSCISYYIFKLGFLISNLLFPRVCYVRQIQEVVCCTDRSGKLIDDCKNSICDQRSASRLESRNVYDVIRSPDKGRPWRRPRYQEKKASLGRGPLQMATRS